MRSPRTGRGIPAARLAELVQKRLDVLPVLTRVPVLTLAWHSWLHRIGERAWLTHAESEQGAFVSRAQPSFVDARGIETGSLDDPHVSRTPIRIRALAGGVSIDASSAKGSVLLDGVPLADKRWLDERALEAGVVLELSASVLLVLQLARLDPRSAEDHGLSGASDAIDATRRAIDIAAKHRDAVLLLGESGTGKELVASAIHRASARAARPFVAINMATLLGATAASELFGHARGAFTGADGAHGGHFGRAHTGTLFLDEIGETPMSVQPMLLRAVESGEVSPVGGRGSRELDVRIIAATDRALEHAAFEGRFRLPLLHRLATHTIALPPLRDRRQDVLPLFVRFLRQEAPDADAATLPIALARRLLSAPWPGNVRELRNVARSLARVGPVALLQPRSVAARPLVSYEHEIVTDARLAETLRRNAFRIGATARELGLGRNALYRRMERCVGLRRARGLDTPEIEESAAKNAGDLERMAAHLEVSTRALQLRLRELGLDARDGFKGLVAR